LKGVSVDYLVNAAGVSRDGLLVQLKEEDIQDTINTNLVGTMTVSQCIAKGMMRKRSGKIGEYKEYLQQYIQTNTVTRLYHQYCKRSRHTG
jgi:NAD(P)-dependent dehydrogenase (short-subunit alcohol dehydrogenase family)